VEAVEAVAHADIPVWGHLGLTPQSIHAFGGFRVQGKQREAARRIVEEARRLETAGACALVLECVPHDLATEITGILRIPTIGIGAGPGCDGQVLVFHDLLGYDENFAPRFVKHYARLGESIPEALGRFAQEVRDGTFPTLEHSYGAGEEPSADPKRPPGRARRAGRR
jgi:3-methyl-2-oxobutanoate hydroxymethyltransferase